MRTAPDTAQLEESLRRMERKAADLESAIAELERANSELTEFAAQVSHDLSEPLRMVASYVLLLARRYRGRLDEDADEFIGYAVEGVTRMRATIDDLMTYALVGRESHPHTLVDCRAIVDQTLDVLAEKIDKKKAVITVGSLPTVLGNSTELGQLFQNLISNGIKFTQPNHPPHLDVSAKKNAKGWKFRVKDNGIGFDPSERERIFRMFTRLHSREEYPGTGIGLALCRKIVERHGGQIWVDSTSDEGTTMAFTLPDHESQQVQAEKRL